MSAAATKRSISTKARTPRALSRYNAKRDFDVTSEPPGTAGAKDGRSFVIQQHDATRMHYDFRLELGGVLLSWAVPKGPSLDPSQKRLAVQTEDHPVSYQEFEGHIPEGEYGGGPVIVWDRGTWTPEADPRAGMKKGHLAFSLEGEKLHGRFSLVRIRGPVMSGPKSTWLLMKHSDEHERRGKEAEVTVLQPNSVVSGRAVSELADAAASKRKAPAKAATAAKPVARGKLSTRAAKKITAKTATRSRMPDLDDVEPQLATLVDRPPHGAQWVHEIKFDGYRMLAAISRGKVRLRSRNHLDWTAALPGIAKALGKLKVSEALLDGELCFIDENGKSDFQRLQNALPRGLDKGGTPENLSYFLFDLLHHDGEDLRGQPLLERKQRLRKLLGSKPPAPLIYSDHLEADAGPALLQACAAGLEGLIAKRGDAPYREGRSQDWLKLKCHKRQEFVIVGMIRASGSRQGFRSLVIAMRDGKQLKFAGRVGTGFSEQSLRDIASLLAKRVVEKSALDSPPRIAGVVWVKPDLVCEVEYTEMTSDGSLRHPSFQGLRQDKSAREVRREEAVATTRVERAAGSTSKAAGPKRRPAPSSATKSKAGAGSGEPVVAGVRISHPEREMDHASHTTKLELARYHEQISDWLMPYAGRRPLSLVRCPQGDAQQCFFQKHTMPGIGAHVRRGRVGKNEVLFVEDQIGVIELVQFNAIEFHGWGAPMAHPDQPDWMVIDLDPDTTLKFSDVVEAALEVRDALSGLKLESWVKTTGGKGLHVTVPLKRKAQWDEVKEFAHALATALESQNPKRYVANMAKAKRVGRIFVDYLRNGQGSTAVLPYSPRARPGATVAMPVAWKDLGKIDPRDFTVRSTPEWLAKRRVDPWKDFLGSRQVLPSLVDEAPVRTKRKKS